MVEIDAPQTVALSDEAKIYFVKIFKAISKKPVPEPSSSGIIETALKFYLEKLEKD